MTTALVTGASSGIGADLAREHAQRGGDLVLVARRKDKLDALAKELEAAHGVSVRTRAVDLSDPHGARALFDWTEAQGVQVDVLVNNAGHGGHGRVLERDVDADLAMIRLNVESLVALTHLYLPGMVARGAGRILQVGSTAGFVPGPGMAVYYATKAFVNSFGQAVHEELRGTGVTCTVLCPGPVATEFADVAGVQNTAAFDRAIGPAETARAAYRAMERGRDVVVVPRYMGALRVAGLFPRRVLLTASRKAMERKKGS